MNDGADDPRGKQPDLAHPCNFFCEVHKLYRRTPGSNYGQILHLEMNPTMDKHNPPWQ